MSEQIAFWMLSAIAVLGALVAVRKRNLIHGVFALMIFFAALSGLFLLLLAEFIAAVQILVYIGAVGILRWEVDICTTWCACRHKEPADILDGVRVVLKGCCCGIF